jgi:hypothetical protein
MRRGAFECVFSERYQALGRQPSSQELRRDLLLLIELRLLLREFGMFPAPVCGSESPHWQSSVNLNCDSRFLKRIGKSAARRCLKTRRHRHVKALCSGTCSANQARLPRI